MSSSSPSSSGVRGFLKRAARGAKKALKPNDQAPTSRPPPPPADPAPQLAPLEEPTPGPLPQSLAQSQKPMVLLQLAPGPRQPSSTALLHANDANQPATATESGLARAAKKAGAEAWAGLRTTLQLLEKSSDIVPTLKSAVAEFLGVVDTFETAARNRNDYAELASNVQSVVREFADRPGEYTSSRMSEALKTMANGLENEMKHVQKQQQRSGLGRHMGAGQDLVDVRGCYRRVETLCRELQNKAIVDIWRNMEEQKSDARLKELNAALKVMYDSSLADVVGRRTCTPGTRKAILAGMRSWADDMRGPKVYWLNGMAGTGKTTLAYSFCAEMQRAHRLGASFFCSRADADSRDVSRIVPTIAHQLARLLPSYREALIRQMGEDKDISSRRTQTQFEKLIRDPLCGIRASVPEGIVVMIDALDECDRRDGAQDILNTLFLYARDLPIKFFVTCRPEPGLFDTLRAKDERYRTVLHLHDIEASFVQADITTYLEDELASIALPKEKIGQLAEQAGSLFIYAATAVRYIHPKGRPVNFRQRLEDVLSMASKADSNKHVAINDLYTAVLNAPFSDKELNPSEKKNIRLVLDTAVCAKEPMSVRTMTALLGLDDEQDIVYATQHLRSVLHLSEGTGLISTFHVSFPDFMLSRERSGDLCCDVTEHNRYLALGCLSTMHRLLRFNICELESSFVLDENIRDLSKKINQAILPELFYACRYWGDHLRLVDASNNIHSVLEDFLSNRLLFWMEVLNLRHCIGVGAEILSQVHAWLQNSGGGNSVLELALDASRFVAAFGLSPASRSTPHIYMSALPFWPETHPIRLRYWKRTQGLIRLKGSEMEGRDLSCLATWNTGSNITCIAQSPDGTRIVSGSVENTIHVWNARSGDLIAGPFKGHTDSVYAVAFSSDGARIVSGSSDNTIRAWDTRSGDLIAGPFKGHTGWVLSVAFSPDGTRIVSGSDDRTIRVWDVRSGDLVTGPFEGHSNWVNSVAFSSNGARIVSGSSDNTIRVWDTHNGDLVAGPFKGHTSLVLSVAFSPNSSHIVSGSGDNTIRVWDARSGLLIAGPFKGHTDSVLSVAFSPDGTRIVSSSSDNTIRVWDAHSGGLIAGPFEGHTSSVHSVVFSPDGTRIVSGSSDNAIRVWDAHSGLLIAGPFKGHTGSVLSVRFSPDGTRIVSGSSDNTIRVWGAHSGDLAAGPFEGHTSLVLSVAFSPDSTCIISSFVDTTIRVWDARSGDLVAGSFNKHSGLVHSTAISPDGTLIVSDAWDNTIRVWDARSGDQIAGPLKGHTDSILSVAFSPDGTRIVSSSSDYTIRVWDARSGDLVAGPFEGHTNSVNSVEFSPDGTRIVSGSSDNTICVWDAHSGDLVAGPLKGHTNLVLSVAFSPDSTRIVSGSGDKTIRVWDARSGDLVAGPFEGHTSLVNSVSFSPDGTRIVSGSRDNAIRVWAATSLHVRDPESLKDWLMDETGMVTTRQGQLLLCVPVDLWAGVVRPQNTICICAKGVLKLDFDGVLLGNNWMKCYQSQ